MTRDRGPALVLTDDEIELIKITIAATEITGPVGDMLTHSRPAAGGRRVTGSYEDFDALLGSLFVEVKGYLRIEEENREMGMVKPLDGSIATKLQAAERLRQNDWNELKEPTTMVAWEDSIGGWA